jgi:hypothetical protein
VVNYGMMTDRVVWATLGGAMVMTGAILLAAWLIAESQPDSLPSTVPQSVPPMATIPSVGIRPPPHGFPTSTRNAINCVPGDLSKVVTSRVAYEATLRPKVDLSKYAPREIEWAWSNNVRPDDFAEFIGYIFYCRDYLRQNPGANI